MKLQLNRLKQNLDRLDLEAELVEADILQWDCGEPYDGVLLDAPCSSTGTLRRHPDVMWTKTPEDVTELAKLQLALVLKARTFVKPGGLLVFSNCSMLKQEGEDLLAAVVRQCQDLSLDAVRGEEVNGHDEFINGQGALRTLPNHLPTTPVETGGMDGFFACRFVKLDTVAA